jgi:TetR/AcrR family transcriptional regulator, fatty acid biosynthesis regulator
MHMLCPYAGSDERRGQYECTAEYGAKRSERIGELLEAAARLVREHGYGGLSISAVAREAGIAQPTFYVHFADKDELVRTLSVEKVEAIRRPLKEARAKIALGHGIDAVRESFRLPLARFLEQPDLFRLYLQEMHQPQSPFGEQARKLQRELEADLIDDLVALGVPATSAAERERLHLTAEGMISLTQTMGLAFLQGRHRELEAVIDVLTLFAVGAIRALREGTL